MADNVGKVVYAIRFLNEKLGVGASLLILPIMVLTSIEVVARYVFNHPTIWVWPIDKQLFALFILFGGGYTLLHNGHIRVEVLYTHFRGKVRFAARLVAFVAFFVFIGSLIWQTAWMGLNALDNLERASGVFRIPLYPIKMIFPVGATIFLLQGIVFFFFRADDDEISKEKNGDPTRS